MIRFSLIGSARIGFGTQIVAPNAERPFGLLLYLGAAPHLEASRESLESTLFPDADSAQASHRLRQMVYVLRRRGLAIETTRFGLRLADEIESDDPSENTPPSALTAELIHRIAAGYVPGYSGGFSEPFRDWLDERRTNSHLGLARVLLRAMGTARDSANWKRLLDLAQAALMLDPLNEEATLARAEALAFTGAKAAAVDSLNKYAHEVGATLPDLGVPARVLRKRISETILAEGAPSTFPLRGRERQLSSILRVMRAAGSGAAGCVAVTGVPGSGKSRILSEASVAGAVLGLGVVQVRCTANDFHNPWSVVCRIAHELESLPGALGASPASLGVLHALSDGRPPTHDHGLGAIPERIAGALTDLVRAVCEERPLLVCIDDAERSDVVSLRSVARHWRKDRWGKAALIATMSPGSAAEAELPLQAEYVALDPLSRKESAELATEMLAARGLTASEEVLEWMTTTAGGLPAVLSLLAGNFDGGNNLSTLPASILELFRHRIQTLDSTTQVVLAGCSILGVNASTGRVADLLGIPRIELARSLQLLERSGLIGTSGTRIRLGHDLIGDSVSIEISEGVRALLHEGSAAILEEELAASDLPSLAWDCAQHWLKAGNVEKHFRHLRDQARRTGELGRPHEAFRVLENAALIELSPPARIPVLWEMLEYATQACDWGSARRIVARIRSDQNAVGSATGDTHAFELELTEAEATCRAGANLEEFVAPLTTRLEARDIPDAQRLRVGSVLMAWSDEMFDSDLAARVLAHCDTATNADSAELSQIRLIYHICFGDGHGAMALAQGILASATTNTDTPRPRQVINASYALIRLGEYETARRHLKRVCGYDGQLPYFRFFAANYLTWISRLDEDWTEASRYHAKAGECLDWLEGAFSATYWYNHLDLALRNGELAAAELAARKLYESCADSHRSGRNWLMYTAARERVRQAQPGYRCDEATLGELLAGHLRARTFGTHDAIVSVLHTALVSVGRRAEARRITTEYATRHRRDRFALQKDLADAIGGALA